MNVTSKDINCVQLVEDGDMVCLSASKTNSRFEPETFDYFEKLTPKGSFIDIGAYTGIYGIRAYQLGWDSVFFEPNNSNFERLLVNLINNGIYCEEVHNLALANEVTTMKLWMNPNPNYTSAGSLKKAPKKSKSQIVEVSTYDSFYRGDEHVIKIDVEGYELGVLMGMKETIKATKPIFIIEVLDDEHFDRVSKFLSEYNYKLVGLFDERNAIFEC